MQLFKYPRTQHFSFSEGATSDDKIISDDHIFDGMDIVITTKMDGENTTVYPNGTFHARSMDSKHRDYHSWLLAKIPRFSYKIPEGYRLCGEYLYARHSIGYDDLPDYFMVFSIWNEDNDCLSWSETKEWCNKIGVITVPELYVGPFDVDLVKKIAKETVAKGQEGIVVRNVNGFNASDFNKNIAKFVRANHVQTDEHWTQQKIVPNGLVKE